MTKDELLKIYPVKTFTQTFNEKRVAFVNLGARPEDFDTKKKQFQQLFRYDELVNDLLKKIKKEDNLAQEIIKKISLHFQRVNDLNNYLNKLNSSEPSNINIVFQDFIKQIRTLIDNIAYTTQSGLRINSNESFIDKEISEVKELLNKHEIEQEKIKEAKELAEEILSKADRYKKASAVAENWIRKEGEALSTTIEDQGQNFTNKADTEHTGWRVRYWLIASIIFFVLAIIAAFMFLNIFNKTQNMQTEISVGFALLRISIIGMFVYSAFLAFQQFANQRKLYEIYKFKGLAFSTMKNLVKTYSDRADRELIVSKAIEIIFNEPILKESEVVQQKMVNELLDIIKKKI
jgi:hypothetical protein